MALNVFLYPGQEPLLIKLHFRKQNDNGNVIIIICCQPAGGGNPAGMPAHDLDHKYPGGSPGHGPHIE